MPERDAPGDGLVNVIEPVAAAAANGDSARARSRGITRRRSFIVSLR